MNSGEIWEEATRQVCEAWQRQECVSVRREAKIPKVMSVWEDQPEGHVSHWEQWNKAGEVWKKPGAHKGMARCFSSGFGILEKPLSFK